MSIPVSPVPDTTYYTTHAPRSVILIGCLLSLVGIFLPWADSNALVLDFTKTGIHDSTLLMASFTASTLAVAGFVLLVRLRFPAPIFTLLIGLLQIVVVGSIRVNLSDPGIGLYLFPAGSALLLVGSLMALAYPPRPAGPKRA